MRSIFGWSLPPGCGTLPGEEPDPPCDVCGLPADVCVCPECTVCGEAGNVACYIDPKDQSEIDEMDSMFGPRVIGTPDKFHGLRLSRKQLAARATVRADQLREQLRDVELELKQLQNPDMTEAEIFSAESLFTRVLAHCKRIW